jgi:hypothetical protein
VSFVEENLVGRPELVRRAFEFAGVTFSGAHRGAEWRVLCPFHPDQHPSLDINVEQGVFICRACGEGGDAVDFYALRENLTVVEAIARLRDELGLRRAANDPWVRKPKAQPQPRPGPVARDVPLIWSGLALSDPIGERYLEGRGLWEDGLSSTDFLRFNTGDSRDDWLNRRADEGYRCAFAARRPDGKVQTIVLRHVGDGKNHGKAPTLAGCSIVGAAICRPEISLLLEGDAEFESDEIALVEGPTSFLAFTLLRDVLYRDGRARASWTLGCVGAGQAAGVVESFGRIIAGRLLRIGLDSDAAGEKHARMAADAAYRVGAKRIIRCKPKDPELDVADLLRQRLA